MTENKRAGYDWSKMAVGEFIKRTPIKLLVTVMLALLGAGFAVGLGVGKRDISDKEITAARETIKELETKLALKEKTVADLTAERLKYIEDNSKLSSELLKSEASRKEAASHAESERRSLTDRVSAAEKAFAVANSRQCPEPTLDNYFISGLPTVGAVEVCVAKASEVVSGRSANFKTIGGYETQAFLRDGQVLFYCTIGCYSNSTIISCNGQSKFAARGLVEQLWSELSRKK